LGRESARWGRDSTCSRSEFKNLRVTLCYDFQSSRVNNVVDRKIGSVIAREYVFRLISVKGNSIRSGVCRYKTYKKLDKHELSSEATYKTDYHTMFFVL
jgi:hypothetical protein